MLCFKGIEDTVAWFEKAKPEPTAKDLSTQIGVHFEEVAEMMRELNTKDSLVAYLLVKTHSYLNELANALKQTNDPIEVSDRTLFLDAICDQLVTAVGVAHQSKMNVVAGLNEVNRSNFSKFDNNGNPILDSNRKIMKGPDYSKPDLSRMV